MITKLYYILISVLCPFLLMGQSTYFNLIPGTRASHLIEEDGQIVTMGIELEDFATEHHYIFNRINSFTGSVLGSLYFDDDTIYSLSNYEVPGSIVEMPDGRFLGVGNLSPESPWDIYATSYIFDTEQDTWELVDWDYLQEDFNVQFKFIRKLEEGYLVGAEHHPGGRIDLALHWLDEEGHFLDYQVYPYEQGQYIGLMDMELTDDACYLLTQVGQDVPGPSPSQQWTELIKIGLDGQEQWRTDMGNREDYLVIPGGISILSDDSIYVSYTYPLLYLEDGDWDANWDDNYPIIDCFSSEGELYWSQSLEGQVSNGSTILHQMDFYEDEGLLLSGKKDSGAFITKVSPELQVEWYHSHEYMVGDEDPPYDQAEFYYLVPAAEGGYLGVGRYRSGFSSYFPNGIVSAFITRMDEDGCLIADCLTGLAEREIPTLDIRPNPSDLGYVMMAIPPAAQQLSIMDIRGQEVMRQDIPQGPLDHRLDVRSLTGGLYIIHVMDKDGILSTGRFMLR